MEFPLNIPKGKGPAFERVSIDKNTYRVMLVLVLFTGGEFTVILHNAFKTGEETTGLRPQVVNLEC